MIKKKDSLTNENLSILFNDNFELAIFAIRLAQHKVHSGAEASVSDVLNEVRKNPPEKGVRKQIFAKEDQLILEAEESEIY